jgi:hypothetical protein
MEFSTTPSMFFNMNVREKDVRVVAMTHSNICTGEMTIPNWVPDGQYAIQAQWYGTGSSFGDKFRGQFNFVSCVDVKVAGGITALANAFTSALKSAIPQSRCKSAATFTPGDVTRIFGCKFFTATTGKVHGCQDNACKCSVASDPDASCYQRSAPPELCGTTSTGTTPATGTNATFPTSTETSTALPTTTAAAVTAGNNLTVLSEDKIKRKMCKAKK